MESTTQIFLRIQVEESDDDESFVKAEYNITGYENRVLIKSFNFGAKALPQGTTQTTETASSSLQMDQVRISKVLDNSSMRLAGLLKARKELYEARITVDQQLEERGVGKAQNAVMVFHLMQARIVEFKLDASEGGDATSLGENVTILFRNFSVEYYYKSWRNNKLSDYRDAYMNFDSQLRTQSQG